MDDFLERENFFTNDQPSQSHDIFGMSVGNKQQETISNICPGLCFQNINSSLLPQNSSIKTYGTATSITPIFTHYDPQGQAFKLGNLCNSCEYWVGWRVVLRGGERRRVSKIGMIIWGCDKMPALIDQLNAADIMRRHLFYYLTGLKMKKFSKIPKKSHIEMRLSTWNKDSHGLYDYESTSENYKTESFYIDASAIIYRDSNNSITTVQLKTEGRQVRESFIPIATISIDRKQNNSSFKFEPILPKPEIENGSYDPTRTFYKVIRQNNPETSTDEGFPLKPGNIVKMGRVEYMVIEMKNTTETLTIRDTNHLNDKNGVFEGKRAPKQNDEDGNEIRCKICLCSEQTDCDPLISPCLCKGSLAKIHVGCLKQWINSKVKKQINDIATSYNFTKFECQICKNPFPRIIKVAKDQIEMMTIIKPNKPYIILESLNRNHSESGQDERCLHLISAKENCPIKIGRGHTCEIRLTDISVSRSHAQILFKNDQFFIKDQKSKFGTLIKFNESHTFERQEIMKIQFGRTLYQLELKGLSEEVDTDE